MTSTPRLFSCARCQSLVTICRACDRGNIYCGKACSVPARYHSLKKAAHRYQKTLKGKLKAALRQKKHRENQVIKNKVTHQGSTKQTEAPLLTCPEKVLQVESIGSKLSDFCCICNKSVSTYVRNRFLSHRYRQKNSKIPMLAQAP